MNGKTITVSGAHNSSLQRKYAAEIQRVIAELRVTGLSWRGNVTAQERAAYLTALLDVEIALLGGKNDG